MDGGSSPLATVEDIQRRLLRPISFPYGVVGATLKEKSTEERSRRNSMTKRKLDDYLDPVLLSTICARAKKEPPKKEMEDLDFQWPDDDLKALMEGPLNNEWRSKEAIDLSEEDSETTVNDAEFCTPFRRFDESALKHFKRFG